MFFNKIHIILLLYFMLCGMSGCSGQTISLEEAILAKDQAFVLSSEADDPALGVGTEGEVGETSQADRVLYVYVCGAVTNPGVYTVPEGSRIVAAIEAAGGFLPEAAWEAVNLAAPVYDSMQIVVPDMADYVKVQEDQVRQEDGRVNLNTATVEALCSLNGIGEAKAEAILAYREEIGSFRSIEQIKEVSGIGDSLFHQIKDKIYIE